MPPSDIIERSYMRSEDFITLANRLSATSLIGRIITPDEAAEVPALNLTVLFDALVENLRARYSFTVPIRLCLLDMSCSQRNACCLRLADTYYVVLPYEMVTHLMYQAELVLACEPFANEFGVGPGLVQITKENAQSFPREGDEPRIEHRPDLMNLARALGEASVLGLLLHELGHVVNGHLGLIVNTAGALSEAGDEVETSDEWLTRQTLEFDADCFAVAQTVRIFSEGRMLPRGIESLVPTRASSVKVGLAALHLMHRSFDSGARWDSREITDSRSHPPARMRLMLIRAVGLRAIERWLGINPDEAGWTFFAHPTVAIEQSFALLGRPVEWLRTADEEEVDLRVYLGRLLSRWAKLRPELSRHKIGSHELAPAQREPA